MATEAVLKTVELVTLALGVRLSHLPPPTIAASEGLTLVSYASWERDRYPRPHPKNNAGIVQLVEMTLSGSSLEVRHRPSKSADESRTQVQILSAAQCHFNNCNIISIFDLAI